jgi:sec-independent protein translocase protein TatC
MEEKKTITAHIKDVKKLFIRLFCVCIIAFCICFYFVDDIFTQLIKFFNFKDVKLIFNSIEGAFLSKMLISFNTAIIVLLPYFAFELVLYVKDAFSKKINFTLVCIGAVVLYFFSVFASIRFIVPIVVNFFLSIGFLGVDFYIDASVFFSFLMQILLAFAFVFQIPILLMILLLIGVISRRSLKKYRRHTFVMSFILGAILTPPDVVSQIIFAIIIYFFYEGVIMISKFFK